ncbi:trypsin-like serine protease [Microbispora sp. ATCC PTA-5024]|uniref:trypsin-like serine protease n=1 Tax=Microbispora sp. ATCC PTA-5024 TaxID=316330 RepID=UPI0003DBA880|nr:trypsin-like serine protease [Microbispora sp. ATCC PTA-5024]ETK34906.1 hypothetical protein MPTA5024_16930 [Microbispora sp. ATCC PTA-5024]
MLLGVAPRAWAITNGTPDGVGHPEVGALIGDKPYRDGTWSYCTGTLVSPTVLLTAAHCGEHAQKSARVAFAAHYKPGDAVHTGRFLADPRYKNESDPYDMAVVLFDRPVTGIVPAVLPEAGLLDRLLDSGELDESQFTPVGYGSLTPLRGKHGPQFQYTDSRYRTSISFKSLGRRWLELSPGDDGGGTCYGDSGGPNFLGGPDSHLLVATTISGDGDACSSTNSDYRLDSASAREFLGYFVTLP